MKIYYDLHRDNAYEARMGNYRPYLFNQKQKLKIITLKKNDHSFLRDIGTNSRFNESAYSKIADFDRWYRSLPGKAQPIVKYRLFLLLSKCLKITQIILSEKDDPMLIFENLNDKGTPLTGDELLCSYIFQPLVEHKDDKKIAEIYEQFWLEPYMAIQKTTIQLKVTRTNIQLKGRQLEEQKKYLFFLRTWFSIGRNKMIGQDKDIYHSFKKEYPHRRNDSSDTNSKQMLKKLEDIKSHVPLFQEAIAPREHGLENKDLISMLNKIDKLKIYTSLTFLMPLLKEWKEKPDFLPELLQILRCVYVFLVRRSLAGLKTTLDNVLFPKLWKDIKDNSDKVEKIKEILRDKELFVTDEALRDRLISANFYAHPLGATVLQEIDIYIVDETMRGEYPDYAHVKTKEHILPQAFDKNKEWKEYLSKEYQDDPRYQQVLDSRLNTIGNLMLVGEKRNSALQNNIFSKKLEKYEPNTGLSKDLLKNYEEKTWNAETIEERSKKLATVVSKIWSWDIT